MKTIEGHFFDGKQPIAIPARLDFSGSDAILAAATFNRHYAGGQLKVSPRVAAANRFIAFPDGTQFICADQAFLKELPQESPSEGIVSWLENRWQAAAACVGVIFLLLLTGYFFGLPALAQRIAAGIPMEKEQTLGRQVLSWFDQNHWLEPSDLNPDTRKKIHEEFNRLTDAQPLGDFFQLEFRSGRVFGPNAFALPGGIIVITDSLVDLAETNEEVMAVLAHEVGHVEKRHAIRSILQNSIVAAAVATVTADASTLSAAVSGLPTLLARKKYSRNFENEADAFAFNLLVQQHYSPEAFASMMEKLAAGTDKQPATFGYLSSHPALSERIRRAREADAMKTMKP
jgi:Zn-dependent protease with chaperone function